jgi:hypothetical protein
MGSERVLLRLRSGLLRLAAPGSIGPEIEERSCSLADGEETVVEAAALFAGLPAVVWQRGEKVRRHHDLVFGGEPGDVGERCENLSFGCQVDGDLEVVEKLPQYQRLHRVDEFVAGAPGGHPQVLVRFEVEPVVAGDQVTGPRDGVVHAIDDENDELLAGMVLQEGLGEYPRRWQAVEGDYRAGGGRPEPVTGPGGWIPPFVHAAHRSFSARQFSCRPAAPAPARQ